MKKRLILFACIILFSIAAYADYIPAVIYLHDGSKIECLLSRPKFTATVIQYKISQKSKVEKIEATLIEKIQFPNSEDDAYGEIVYMPYYKMIGYKFSEKINKPIWLNVLIEGPATLYRSVTGYYMCKRPDEPAARVITMTPTDNTILIGNPLAVLGAKYFADYPELAERLKNKEFKSHQAIEVVNEYNLWKSAQKKKK